MIRVRREHQQNALQILPMEVHFPQFEQFHVKPVEAVALALHLAAMSLHRLSRERFLCPCVAHTESLEKYGPVIL